MKIAIGTLYHESNSFNPFLAREHHFVYAEGKDVLERMVAPAVFQKKNVDLVPLIFASSLPYGIVAREVYDTYFNRILNLLKEHHDLDGIFLHLHGSMEVEGLGSGEYHLLKEIREQVGEKVVIGLALDLHANNDPRLAALVNVMRGYRTAPHTDQEQTEIEVANHILACIEEKKFTAPQFVRLPYAIHPEKALSSNEPLRGICEEMNRLEKEEGISIVSMYVGMMWCDCPNLASTVSVTPTEEKYAQKAKELAKEFADYIYSLRDSFEFVQLPLPPSEAIPYAISFEESPVYISDSGDNTTGGAVGDHTILLREFLSCSDYNGKKVLITNIWDEKAVELCEEVEEGSPIALTIGSNRDKDSAPVEVEGILKRKGTLYGYMGATLDAVGKAMTISLGDLDIVVTDVPGSFTSFAHFEGAGLNLEDYHIIVVKQGYLFAELSQVAKLAILALTPGATHQIIENLKYERITHPLYPFS